MNGQLFMQQRCKLNSGQQHLVPSRNNRELPQSLISQTAKPLHVTVPVPPPVTLCHVPAHCQKKQGPTHGRLIILDTGARAVGT